MESKPTNPKDTLGIKKAPLHCLPCDVLMELGLAMAEGAIKYGAHNYRDAGVRASVYYDALQRHIMAWWEGEDIDPDSGVSHLIKAMACLVVLRDSMNMENWVDDRPMQLPNKLNMPKYNRMMEELIKKYDHQTEVPPFTQIRKESEDG